MDRCRRIGVCLILIAALPPAGGRSAPPDEPPPVATRKIEKAGITLLLLDVEAVDRQGRPLRGLKKEDFRVQLDFRSWPIYSVDDLCTGRAEPPAPAAGAPSAPAPAAPAPAERRRYILYFDFSQMRMDGRLHARAEAERMVRETMEPGDEVMLAAYSSATGLKRLTTFTGDRRALIAAIEEAYSNRDFIESFALELESRREECESFPKICSALAQMEYWHGRQSLKVLEIFMSNLESFPGSKQLILFTQNGVMFPGRLYAGADAPDHYAASQELAAAANAAQISVYTASTESDPGSDLAKEERVLGDNLADFTGGGYNRGALDLASLTAAARRQDRCIYRIGLLPASHPTRDVLAAKVTAGGVVLDRRYRVRFETERDRWLRQAAAVLADPASAIDIEVASAIVPESAERSGWNVEVEIAFDARALTWIPSARGKAGAYEVGAMLTRGGSSRGVELFSAIEMRTKPETEAEGLVVHSRKLFHLAPGDYRLAAFVRDRTLNVFGGSEALLTLPDPKKGGFAGPLLLRGPEARTRMPLQVPGAGAPEAPAPVVVDRGVVPLSSATIRSGTVISGLTWICPGRKSEARVEVRRSLTQGGEPVRRFEAAAEAAGLCLRFADLLDTSGVIPDAYAYEVRWRPDAPIPDLGTSTKFEIFDPARATDRK